MKSAYQLSNVRVCYENGEALNIPSLTLPQNQCTAILGENGAGKSTLMHLLAFLLTPTDGTITLFGQTLAANADISAEQRRHIGFVAQQPLLLAGTVRDNIHLALRLQGIDKNQFAALTEEALETVNLKTLADHDARKLSGGELKRAAIARAIAYQPDILILDEPFSHLDQRHIRQLEETIHHYANKPGKTVIFSTHDRIQGMVIAQHSVNLVKGHLTESPILNLFHGHFAEGLFDTGRLKIQTHTGQSQARYIAIDPREIIVSERALEHSSLLNCFEGRVTQISEEAGHIHLMVNCGEYFHILITAASMQNLALRAGTRVWINFQPSAVTLI